MCCIIRDQFMLRSHGNMKNTLLKGKRNETIVHCPTQRWISFYEPFNYHMSRLMPEGVLILMNEGVRPCYAIARALASSSSLPFLPFACTGETSLRYVCTYRGHVCERRDVMYGVA